MSICILCRSNPPIENSHVVPNFAIRRLKAGNPLQTLIHSDALNKTFQDGWKGGYLCTECEIKFGRWESWFCQSVYVPFLAGTHVRISYDNMLGLFAASLAFRFIRFAIDKNPTKAVPDALTHFYENLRVGLLTESLPSITAHSYIQFHFPVETVAEFPPGINTYFFEAIDGKLFTYVAPAIGEFWLVYVKLPGLFFVSAPHTLDHVFKNPVMLTGQEIVASGFLESNPQCTALSHLVRDIFCERATEIQMNYSLMPESRVAKIEQKISALPDREKYRAHQTYTLDKQLLADWQTRFRQS
jgi:hypothetical protein